MSELAERFETHDPGEKQVAEKIRCDACPVMCYIADGRTGACARYGNVGGRIVRMDPLTGGSKAQGRATCDALLNLCNRKPVELTIDGGATVIVEAGKAPVIDGKVEHRMRVGCGSATIGMFATQWRGLVDEVVVVDD